ncbi:ABC transporter permease [Prosthecomicrobium sp. N25]|uniref:ABC transporter permease n=1 Tax=Prosthecomicrobium sp. N25 TaxID=3129254 RepID=UPI00307710AD
MAETSSPAAGVAPPSPASADAARYRVADRAPGRWSERLLAWNTILVLLLAAVVAVNATLSPYFLDVYNLSDATFNFSEKAIVALAMALLILVREIDLSVAATMALASLAMGFAAEAGAPPALLVAVGLGVGLACGAVNGALVTGFGLPSIVVTIGTMSLFRGIAQVILGDQAITRYPPAFQAIGQGYVLDWPPVPVSLALFLGIAAVTGVVLARTPFGRRLYAIGNNPVAARFSGIRVDRIRFLLFLLAGLAAGLASVLLTARIGSTRPNIALGWELEIVTMVVLGGVSIAGGSGSILGVVLAVFVLGLATFGLTLVNVPGIVINIALGLLLVVAIATPIVIRRLMPGLAQRS